MRRVSNLYFGTTVDTIRNKRVRRLVRKLNRARKAQARKIDILCNDMINAHKRSLAQLDILGKTAEFYEELLGVDEFDAVLERAAGFVQTCLGEVNVAIWANGGFRLHTAGCDAVEDGQKGQIEDWFGTDVIEAICGQRNCQSLNDLLAAGLEANPRVAKTLDLVAIPLARGMARGFLVVYRGIEKPFSAGEIKTVCGIMPGLCKAMVMCMAAETA